MFRGRRQRRIEQLEDLARVAQLERAEMQRKLQAFEAVCAAIGVHLDSGTPHVVPEVPAALIAATRAPGRAGEAVLLRFGERRVIAVIGPGGEPETWMPVLAGFARGQPQSGVTRIERVPMPTGLLAAAALMSDEPGMTVRVDETLSGGDAHAAVLTAIRAARRSGVPHGMRLAAFWPVAILAPLMARAARAAIAAHPLAAASAAAVVAAGSAAVVVLPSLPITGTPVGHDPAPHHRMVTDSGHKSSAPTPNSDPAVDMAGAPSPSSSSQPTSLPTPLVPLSVSPPSTPHPLRSVVCITINGQQICL